MTLIVTLTCLLVSSVILTALVGYATTSNRSVRDYQAQRDRRYAGDGAIKAAINWARTASLTAVDAAAAAEAPCLHLQTETFGVVTVSCHPPAGGSGPRVVFVACIQSAARLAGPGVPCNKTEDKILAQAGVDLQVAPAGPPSVATIRWWSTDR